MSSTTRRKNLVIAMSLAGAALLAFNRWVLPALIDLRPITDGARSFVAGDDRLRFAVWEEPQPLRGEIDTPQHESCATVSPDGRWMVFVSGEAGAGSELFLAPIERGLAGAPRALADLNSAADEIAPCFGGEVLYFASNRAGGAGGFDLYASAWDGTSFSTPSPVEGGLNTEADEVDPAPDAAAFVFASNRPRDGRTDFDLYSAGELDANGKRLVQPVASLASPADEREPALTADGRSMYFASNREGGLGDFDLYRTFREHGAWTRPALLEGLESPAAERAPRPSADGFTLNFDRSGDAARELWSARSVELFRGAEPLRGLADLLLMLALLLLALVAALSKRFSALDLLYKCLLISALLHLLFLIWSRYLEHEAQPWEVPRPRDERTFRVRLEQPRERMRGLVERGGALEAERTPVHESDEPQRLELARAEPSDTPSPSAALERAESELAPAPERSEVDLQREEIASAAEPEVASPSETRELLPTDATELALGTPSSASIERSAAPASGPVAAESEREFAVDDQPSTEPIARRSGSAPEVPAPSVAPGDARPSSPASERSSGPAVALPTEARELRSGAASEAALEPPESGPVARSAPPASGPVAARGEREFQVDDEPSSAPLARRSGTGDVHAPAPRSPSSDVARSEASRAASSGPDVALPEEARERIAGGAPSAPALEARSFEAPPSASAGNGTSSGPEHAQVARSGSPSGESDALPAPRSFERRGSGSASGPSSPYEPGAAEPSSSPSTSSAGPSVALPAERIERAPIGSPEGSREALPAPLAIAPQRRSDSGGGPSERYASPNSALEASSTDDAPSARPLAGTPRARGEGLPAAPPRLDDTPYRSRFGTEKEIALREHGGTVETERAVAQGLRYLASKQRRDGSWGDTSDRSDKYRDVRVGKTALALLAFLGAGHTPISNGEHSAVTDRAIRWLLAQQDGQTGHFGDSEAYSHGIATYALAECYAITREERLRPAVERAVAQILRQQLTRGDARRVGGWSYYYPDGAIFDSWPRTSITSWQVMALESARLGGLDVPDETFERARQFLVNAWDEEMGRFRYNHSPERLNQSYRTLPGSTPAALFALSLLGEDLAGARWSDAVSFIASCAPDGYRWEGEEAFVERAQGNLYFWYYGSLALLRRGGTEWERWNAALKDSLPPAQAQDGSWQPLDVYCEYAGDDDSDRIYSTSMCVLSLEVYYRYFTPLLRVDRRR